MYWTNIEYTFMDEELTLYGLTDTLQFRADKGLWVGLFSYAVHKVFDDMTEIIKSKGKLVKRF